MKNKVILVSKAQAEKWISTANVFARSQCPGDIALQQFNHLSAKERHDIKSRFEICNKVRRNKIPNTEEDAWLLGIMVDAHIIATFFGVDPLAVMMCLYAPCKSNARIIIK